MIDPRLERDVKAAEGCRLTAYRDTRGFWTIGYGHFLPNQGRDWTGYTITQAQADEWLAQDLETAQHSAQSEHWFSSLNPCRANAVTELVFNMGLKKWLEFKKCRAALAAGEWADAATELLDSKWAMQVGLGRSNRLATCLHTGEYPA